MKKVLKRDLTPVADFLFEAGMLARTPRSGFFFLGSGDQSVAEHINRVTYIGYVLAKMNGKVDLLKILQMCMFHDFAEARTSDPNYVHQKYLTRHEHEAIADLSKTIPFGDDMVSTINEYEERKSLESLFVKDADNLEFILTLKEQKDIGNERAASWLPSAVNRLKTKEAQELVKYILKTDSDNWWFGDKENEWWVSRNKK